MAERAPDGKRDKVRLRIVVLAELPIRVRPRGIEIPQRHPAQPVRSSKPLQRSFHKALRFPVGIDGKLDLVFSDGEFRRDSISRTG